jgi:transcriptional regulator with XRE-family HTH domain
MTPTLEDTSVPVKGHSRPIQGDGRVLCMGQESPHEMDKPVQMSDIIRQRRTELGLSQAELGARIGVDKRQIRRYETGDTHPALPVAVELAKALEITLDQLAGQESYRLDLSGQWWASWQTSKDQHELITLQEVRITQRGDDLVIQTVTRGIPLEEGGYHWRGELRLWDNEILMGWYAATDGSVRSKGTMYFVLHPHGQHMTGRWVGLSYDGKIMTGWASMSRDKDAASEALEDLKTGKDSSNA